MINYVYISAPVYYIILTVRYFANLFVIKFIQIALILFINFLSILVSEIWCISMQGN